MEKKHRFWFALILLVGLIIRLGLAPARGHVHDIEQLKIWTETAVLNNPLAVYNDSTANYPPLGLLPLIIVGHLYHLFFPEFDSTSPILTFLIKLPAITADLVTAVLLFRYIDQNDNRRWAFLGLSAYIFNPAILYDSAWWGQLESLVTLPMILSVMALSNTRIRWSWLWLAAAVLVKPQAAIIAPIVLLGSLQQARKWRQVAEGMLIGILFGIIVLLPLIVVGQLPSLVAQIQASAGRQLFLTMNAHNLWFLVTLGQGSFAAREGNPILDTQPLIGPLTGWHLGLLLFFLWMTIVLVKQYRLSQTSLTSLHSPRPILFYTGAALVLGFYLLPAEAHERYLFPALAFMVVLMPGRRTFQTFYLLFSLTLFLNLFWVDSAVTVPQYTQNLAWGVFISAVNVVLGLAFLGVPNFLLCSHVNQPEVP